MTQNPYGQYRKTSIQTASQGRLVVMCFEVSARNARQAGEAIRQRRLSDAHEHLIKAQRIVTELYCSLDRSVGEIGESIAKAYEALRYRLVQANVRKDAEMCEKVAEDLDGFAKTWEEVFRKVEAPSAQPPLQGVSIRA
jgi:flagellar protein FliS